MHNLEIGINGVVNFASRREPAWHGLGQVVNAETMDWREILTAANLDNWNVRTLDLSELLGEKYNFGRQNPLLVVRDNPFGTDEIDILGQVTERYNVFSNEETFEFADNLVNGTDVELISELKPSWETAGSIDEGRRIFGSLALEREIVIDENGAADTVKVYLLVTNSHDGSTKLTILVTPVRVVCQNTLNFALKGAHQSFKVKHTNSMKGRIEEARNALGLTDKYIKAFEKVAVNLHSQKVTDQKFFEIVKGVFGDEPEENIKGSQTKWQKNIDNAMGLWRGETQANIAGTGWAAVNALTELKQWGRGIRKGDTDSFFEAGAGFDLAANKERNNILSLVTSMA